MAGKIIQIMPAPSDLYGIYDFGSKKDIVRVLCLALTDLGEILIMELDKHGKVSETKKEDDFQSFGWKNK